MWLLNLAVIPLSLLVAKEVWPFNKVLAFANMAAIPVNLYFVAVHFLK